MPDQPWHIEERGYPSTGFLAEQLAFAAQYARLAPSSHNSQPWKFLVDDGAIRIRADRTRALAVVDPNDRELVISCGAALFHLRVALAHFGHEPAVDLTPDTADPDVLAVVRPAGKRQPTADDERLFGAIMRRHTHRGALSPRELPPALVAELGEIARRERAWLYVAQGMAKEALASLIGDADRVQMADPRFRRELACWIHPDRVETGDGMPDYAQRLSDLRTSNAPLALRTFDAGGYRAAKNHELAAGSPLLIVLGTDGDTELDWMRVGQALDGILLRAAADGIAGSFLNQPIEVPDLRRRLQEVVGRDHAQLIVRLGFAGEAPPTPRRPYYSVIHRTGS